MSRLAPLVVLALLTGCASFPAVDAAFQDGSALPAPELVPLETLDLPDAGAAEARGAALAAEAAALKQAAASQ